MGRGVTKLPWPVMVLGIVVMVLAAGCSRDFLDVIKARGTPSGVSITAGDGEVTVSWDAVAGADSYTLYWNTSGVVTTSDTQIAVAISPYTHTGLTNGTSYFYVVTAVNAGGESALSSEVSATPQVPAPGVPSGVSVTAGDGEVTVSWDAVGGADSYNLYWNTGGAVTTSDDQITEVASLHTHTGLTNGTSYFYVVTAVSAGGESALSSQVSGTPQATAPGVPSGMSPADQATTTDTTPLLTWDEVDGAASYEVQIAESEEALTEAEVLEAAGAEYQVATGLSLATWYWRVRAIGDNNVPGSWSAALSFQVSWEYTVTGISPTDGASTVDTTPLLAWDTVDGAASYEVQIAESEAALAEADVLEAAGAEYQIATTLSVGDVRYWRVRGVNEDGVVGAWSAAWSFEVFDPVGSNNTSLTSNGLAMQMVSIIAYCSSDTYDTMTLTSYALSETEVTQGDYEAVIGSNPAHDYGVGSDYPVYYVSWYDAVEFCNALSTLCGLEAVYDTGDWSADFTKSGFYLPTEAQWEYAAGGPNHHDWSLGDTFDTGDYACSVAPQTLTGTIAVKSHAANGFGLYDMSGNVWEWCHDWYGDTYPHSGETDPAGPSSGSDRVLRGGSWYTIYSASLRCDDRAFDSPGYTYYHVGFRVAVGGHGLW